MKKENSQRAPLSPEQAAFLSALCREHYAWLYKYARSKLPPDEAEDVVQELFLLASRRIETLMASPSPAGWLARTLRFLALNWREREGVRDRRRALGADADGLASPGDELGDVEIELSVRSALTDEEYGLYYMVYRENCSMTEAAARLGLTPEAVWKRMERIRKRLRREVFPP